MTEENTTSHNATISQNHPSDRTARSYNDRPSYSHRSDDADRSQKRAYTPRDTGSEGAAAPAEGRYSDRAPREGSERSYSDRAPRSSEGSERSYSDRPQRTSEGRSSDRRPSRPYSSDRPSRPYSSDRPSFGSDRPRSFAPRPFSSDRPSFGSDRPRSFAPRPFSSDRPRSFAPRSFSSDRSSSSEGRSFSSRGSERSSFSGRSTRGSESGSFEGSRTTRSFSPTDRGRDQEGKFVSPHSADGKPKTTRESTLVLIKPDLTVQGIDVMHDLMQAIGSQACSIIKMKKFHLTEEQAKELYAEHASRPFFDELVGYVTNGDVIVLHVTGKEVIKKVRDVLGATDPTEAADGTIRRKYGKSIGQNGIHASDSIESGERELAIIFA